MSNVYYNDIDPYCCKVLQKNIERGYLPQGDIDERDIRDVRAEQLVGYQHIHLFAGISSFALAFSRRGLDTGISIATVTFPCQDISNVGPRDGIEGKRSGLWGQAVRLLRGLSDRNIRPQYIIVENVQALLLRGMGRVLGDLAALRYDAEWQVLPASAFGASHIRERVFIIAYPMCEGLERERTSTVFPSHLALPPLQLSRLSTSDIVRARDGIPNYVDRITALGNSIDVRVAEYIASCIVAYEQAKEAVA